MDLKRENYSSEAPMEEKIGYSRAVRVGPFIYIGGTTAVLADGSVFGENDGYAQTKFILEKMIRYLEKAGGKKEEVIRVKMYVTNMNRTREYIQAYSEFFKEIKPLCTLVGISALNRPNQLIEVEIDAIKGSTI